MGRHDPMLSFYSVVQQRGIMLPVAVNNGKKLMVVRIVKHATMIIHLLTDANPIQSIVDAVINSGLREDITKIGYAGVVRRQAVDISPLRRVNQAIYLLPSVPVKMHSKMSISLLSALLMSYQCGQGFFQQLCNQEKNTRSRELPRLTVKELFGCLFR